MSRARWAKAKRAETVHTSAQDEPSHTEEIAAAQRARWAKVKAQQRAEKKIA